MRAITIQGTVLQFREDLPEPIPTGDEVLLEVLQAGICETDLRLARGYMGFSGILGHEFVAVATLGRCTANPPAGTVGSFRPIARLG